jgi:hypothetical protein
MSWTVPEVDDHTPARIDEEGGLLVAPPWLRYVWIVLGALVGFEALEELGVVAGPASLAEYWIHDVLLAAATALMVARAFFEPVARRAWLVFGAALASWWAGTVSWTIAYGGQAHPPYPTFADGLWLAWYPLMAAGMVLLVRVRFERFELHRWMDGVAVVLMVLVAGVALVVQPLAAESPHGRLATVVDFSYPVLDVLLIGAVLGIYGLLSWRPDAMWVFVGLGVAASTGADAAFAVQQAGSVVLHARYSFVWTLGALFLAYAGWAHAPNVHPGDQRVTGMRAVALALAAQVLAVGIQIYAYFEEVGRSERIVTAVVLVVASVQIVVARPRPDSAPAGSALPARSSDPADPAAPKAGAASRLEPPDRGDLPDPTRGASAGR